MWCSRWVFWRSRIMYCLHLHGNCTRLLPLDGGSIFQQISETLICYRTCKPQIRLSVDQTRSHKYTAMKPQNTQILRYNFFLCTVCPTRYQTWHFFNNSKFEQEYVRCVKNEEECVCSVPNCCDMEQRSASQPASLPVIKEMPGSVASGTPYIFPALWICN